MAAHLRWHAGFLLSLGLIMMPSCGDREDCVDRRGQGERSKRALAEEITSSVRSYVTREGVGVTPAVARLLAGQQPFRVTADGFAIGGWVFDPKGKTLIHSYTAPPRQDLLHFEMIKLEIGTAGVTVLEITRGTWQLAP